MAGLATSSAGAAAGFLANKIGILVQLDEKLKAMAGTKRKMKEFKELSKTIDEVIQDIESRPFIEDAVKGLLKQLKYLAYDLEDVVDYYDTKALQKKQRSKTLLRPVRDFFSSNNKAVFKIKVGGMIKAITESLDSILLQKSFLFSLPQNNIRMSEQSLYRESHSRNSFDVIGREPEKNMIVHMLTNDDDESSHSTLKVIAIIGMGGLGKTTLAQFVFNDERVKAHFESSRMWTVVGAEFDPAKIMKSVLEQATNNPSVNFSEMETVRQNLEKALFEKRFLLVLDDVWNEEVPKWNVLEAALTCGAKGSKILVTTRSQQVSLIMGSSNTTHQIQPLPREHCLSLFQQFAFRGQAVDQNLMKIGEKIVEKCGGVPLAIHSLGSMLLGVREETYWSRVSKSEIWQLRDGERKVAAVLKLSYGSLSLQSKKCFAFGSLFPKDCRMRKDELIKLWIANGFVSSERNFDAEILGNHVFDDLVKRSFFLLAPSRYGEDVTDYTMHDLMHDLARSVSVDAYWNSYQDSLDVIGKRTYHLQIVEGKLPDMTQVLHKKPLYLRTFMLPYQNFSHLSINLHEVFSELKFLRALDLTGCGIREIPTSIGNLIHLRLLNLSQNEIEVLPDSITILFNLQYLNLRLNSELQKLPKELGNMQNLRELDLPRNCKLTHMPCGLSRLINLQSLPIFIAGVGTDACSILELEGLKLRGAMEIKISSDFKNYSHSGRKILKNADFNELCIRFDCSAEKITSSVFANNSLLLYRLINDYINDYEVDRIESLRQWIPSFIAEETYHKDMLDDLCPNTSLKKLQISNYRSPQFPTWLIELQLPNLVEVDLSCFCKQIPPFQNLQSLEMLTFSMHGITHLGAEFHGSGGFPSLQQLCLNRMPDLEEWSESHGDDKFFPSLHSLKIFHCPKLKSMPTLPKIQNLDIQNCNSSLLSCIGKLTSLSVLQLMGMSEMTSLPSGCLRNLTALTLLVIADCQKLQSFPWDEIKHLETFHSLNIEWCDKLTFLSVKQGHLEHHYIRLYSCPSIILDPEIFVENLNSVPYFTIKICSNKVNLCGRLQNLCSLKKLYLYGAHGRSFAYKHTSRRIPNICICCCDELKSLMTAKPVNNVLEELYIDRIPNLKALPDWLHHLKSLRLLSIRNCPLLEMVPSYLKDLRMLEDLRIVGCPQLESRCERETGEDWSIISKVPNVYVCSSDSAEHCEEFRRGGHRRSTPSQSASASDTAGLSHAPNQFASTSDIVGPSHAPSPPELSPLHSPVPSPRQSAAEM